jgi:hypothetical protein
MLEQIPLVLQEHLDRLGRTATPSSTEQLKPLERIIMRARFPDRPTFPQEPQSPSPPQRWQCTLQLTSEMPQTQLHKPLLQ